MKKLLALFTFLAAFHAQAQLDSCNVFLKGNYLEVGISSIGSYGSTVPMPAGYYGNTYCVPYNECTSSGDYANGIGFVADIDKDGFTTGFPAYYGDYVLPGDPFEGWELQIDTMRLQAFNATTDSGFIGSLAAHTSGSNISYSDVSGIITATWSGMVDSIGVTQVTTVDAGGLYAIVQVTLTNNASTPVNNIYYLRSLDPDNDEAHGGTFATDNVIINQSQDTSIVTATGQLYNDTMALGTTDSNSRSLIYTMWPIADTVDLSTVYNQTFGTSSYIDSAVYDADSDYNGDYALGLVHYIPHLGPVDSGASGGRISSITSLPPNTATFTFFYAFGNDAINAAIYRIINGTPLPADTISTGTDTTTTGGLSIKNINARGAINVYPNPATNTINVTGINIGDNLALIDMLGRTMPLNQLSTGSGTQSLSVSLLPPGSYILIVRDGAGNVRSRVKVQKQ